MKQLLFLLLFPAFAMAQYPGNAGQKITLGEQTTADGLVWRGRLADTANLLTNKLDTSVYIVLDTGTRAMWYYRASTTPKWTRLVDSLNNLQGTLSVAKGGTGSVTQNFVDLTTTQSIGGAKTFTSEVTATRFNPTANTATGTGMFLPAANTLGFSTNGTEKVRITSAGNVGIATTSPTNLLHLAGESATPSLRLGSVSAGFYWDIGRENQTTGDFVFNNANGGASAEKMRITIAGNVGIGTISPQSGYRLHVVDSVYIGGNVSASAYTTRSDYELKDEIQNISYGINEVMQMQPVKYTYKSNGSTQLGFIAQDLGVITPEVVSFENKMSVYYNALIPILTKAIQEQQALIKALEQRIINLENK